MELAKHIELAPRNGDFVVLLDGCSDAWEVGRWSPESNRWLQIDGKPVRIFPTHWVPVSGDAAGSENCEGLTFLVPPPAPIQTVPKHHRATVILAVAATAVFLGGCAAYGFGLIGTRPVWHAGETVGSATAISREASAAPEAVAVRIKQEAVQADATESRRTADPRQNELKQAADEKETLAGELAAARRQLAVARDDIALHVGRENAAQAEAREAKRVADARQKELKLSLAETKARIEALVRERHGPVASGAASQAQLRSQAVAGSNASSARSDAAAAPRPTAVEPSQSPAANANTSSEEARMVARADWLIKQSDFAGARLLLEHALEKGSARAAFMMAETYDWRTLRSMQAYGVRGDVEKARELYELAAMAGIEQARERLEALK
jgi:hypothetical protein